MQCPPKADHPELLGLVVSNDLRENELGGCTDRHLVGMPTHDILKYSGQWDCGDICGFEMFEMFQIFERQ